MALEAVRLRCSGNFWPWRGLVSCRFPGQGTEASGSVPLTGRESEAPQNVPVAAGLRIGWLPLCLAGSAMALGQSWVLWQHGCSGRWWRLARLCRCRKHRTTS
jgi:hypothetical protein